MEGDLVVLLVFPAGLLKQTAVSPRKALAPDAQIAVLGHLLVVMMRLEVKVGAGGEADRKNNHGYVPPFVALGDFLLHTVPGAHLANRPRFGKARTATEEVGNTGTGACEAHFLLDTVVRFDRLEESQKS